MDDGRAAPEIFLKQIEAEEAMESRGRLKIFLGYAAGVGKTYAMLQAAHQAMAEGIDVVAGYIEPHDRAETKSLMEGLVILPPLEDEHHGVRVREFDLDAALERKPELILVDELAHTNGEGCRHAKRYQDIAELLKAGINVYTTVNIQHVESLNDIVAGITGVMVRERIPDRIFDSADSVTLVDIDPGELIDRLKAGKIYNKIQAERAVVNFFTIDNLMALREIALRRMAERETNRSAFLAMGEGRFSGEHILVCVSSAPSSARIIRAAARLAKAFQANLTALFVETTDFPQLSAGDKNRLRENFKLAEQLDAHLDLVYGDEVPEEIMTYAQSAGITKIVLGKSNMKSGLFGSRRTLVEKLSEMDSNLDIYIIPDQEGKTSRRERWCPWKSRFPDLTLKDSAKTVAIFVLAVLLSTTFRALAFNDADVVTVFLLAVLVTAVVTRERVYSVAMAIMGVVVFNFLFVDPLFTLATQERGFVVTYVVMFIAALVSGHLASSIKKQAEASAQTAQRTGVLLETNQLLQRAADSAAILETTARQLMKLSGRPVVVYGIEDGELAEPHYYAADASIDGNPYLVEHERLVAHWVYVNNQHAGVGTKTFSGAKCLYLAIRNGHQVFGVVGIAVSSALEVLENNLILSILGEAALALEKDLYNQKQQATELKAQQEKLRGTLLRAISHDLRTPLTSISGNARMLMTRGPQMEDERRNQLVVDIYDDSLWLINLVENLLSITRLEENSLPIKMEAELVEDIVNEALQHTSRLAVEYHIGVKPMDPLLMAQMDARLIIQVIINLVDNAIKYTAPGSTILIGAQSEGKGTIGIEISDDGPGMDPKMMDQVFEMFYTAGRGSGDSRRGLGLGLPLCKNIIEAHGGELTVRANKPMGTVFHFTLKEVKIEA
ncbi:two-component system, OmpR family, sensor histidine kinase KdpD [Eubacterium aggregans]|uniref:histidine kinase n=1 Tax=Eubacterium aggregans TaxID=81409 RepID=A0A1H3ZAI4_9FIRM|nr:sensor histidine kinase KdpD [Eubacterium aggregans]SEA20697.1 two-component system, OmpR family, sensor histidine kinase KdpD [Eubacterium aggregans]